MLVAGGDERRCRGSAIPGIVLRAAGVAAVLLCIRPLCRVPAASQRVLRIRCASGAHISSMFRVRCLNQSCVTKLPAILQSQRPHSNESTDVSRVSLTRFLVYGFVSEAVCLQKEGSDLPAASSGSVVHRWPFTPFLPACCTRPVHSCTLTASTAAWHPWCLLACTGCSRCGLAILASSPCCVHGFHAINFRNSHLLLFRKPWYRPTDVTQVVTCIQVCISALGSISDAAWPLQQEVAASECCSCMVAHPDADRLSSTAA